MGEETEASGLGEAGKEDSCHTGAAVDATQSSLLNEGGKKDPLTRRRELLVNSGLAEVNTFYFLIHISVELFFIKKISMELFFILSYQGCRLAHFTFCDPSLLPLFFSLNEFCILPSFMYSSLSPLPSHSWSIMQKLIDACCEMAKELLRSNFGKEVIYEVLSCWFNKIVAFSMYHNL